MAGRSTQARGLRLPNELWGAIDSEAQALGMSANELLGRRITSMFARVHGNRKTVEIDRKAIDPDTLLMEEDQ